MMAVVLTGIVDWPRLAPAQEPVSDRAAAVASQQFNAASFSQEKGQYRQAAQQWVVFIDSNRTDARLDRGFYNLGICYLKSGQRDLARQSFEALLSAFPNSPLDEPGMLYLGLSQYNLAQAGPAAAAGAAGGAGPVAMYEAAVGTFQGFRKRYPASTRMPEALFYEAESYYELGRKAQAIELYLHLTARYKQHEILPDALYALGVAQQEANQPAAAGKTFDEFLERFPQHGLAAEVTLRRGEMFYALADFPAAAERFAQAAARNKFSLADQALLRQAAAVEQLGRQAEAAGLYASLPPRFPRSRLAPQALYDAARLNLALGASDAALKLAASFMRQYPDHELWPRAAFLAAQSNLQLGRHAEAQQLLEKLIQNAPHNADVPLWQVRLGLALFLQKQYAATVAALEPLATQWKDDALRAEAQYLLGSSQAELGRWQPAVAALRASLAAAPHGRQADDALWQLARGQRQLGDAAGAQTSLRRLIDEIPQSRLVGRALLRLGEYRYADGEFASAAQAYQELLDRDGQADQSPRALCGLGWARLGQREYAAADAAFSRVIQQFPGDRLVPQAHYARATARQQLQQFPQAIVDLQAVLGPGKTPAGGQAPGFDRADARYLLALCQVALKKNQEAVATLQALLTESPQFAGADKALYELAWAYDALHQPQESAAAFARLAGEHPGSALAAESRFHAAQYAYDQDDFAAAAQGFAAAADKAPNATLGENARHKQGLSYYRLDDFVRAAAAFHAQTQAWPAGPLAADAAFLEGESLAKLKRYAEALAAYRRVTKPGDAKAAGTKPAGKDFELLALLHGGQAAAELHQWPEALRLLEEAARRFPASAYEAEILCLEAAAQEQLGHAEQALQLCRDVLAKTDREPAARAQFVVGQIQFQRKQYAEAAQTFFKVALGYSYPHWQAEATFEAARCFEALGDKRRAAEQYADLVSKFPQGDHTPAARARLAELKK